LAGRNAPESNIHSPQDALWWAYATITTVGYGDKYPVTPEGRLIAAVLMSAGVGLFGSFTGLIASWVLKPTRKDTEQNSELKGLREQVAAIERRILVMPVGQWAGDAADSERLAQIVAAWPALPADAKTRILAAAVIHRADAA